jgi:subfamily B ATP-binding cassette protein HlyB/CyaB
VREIRLNSEDMVWLLGAACQLHQLPFDSSHAARKYKLPHTLESLRAALYELGLRSEVEELPLNDLSELSDICFAIQRQTDTEKCNLVLFLHSDGKRVLFVVPGQDSMTENSIENFSLRYAGFALRFSPEFAGSKIRKSAS